MKTFLTQFFTWWNGQTLGTRFHTWRFGKRGGEDEAGNVYYEGGTNSDGRTRRWVIYNGYAEASSIPPGCSRDLRSCCCIPTRASRSSSILAMAGSLILS